MSNQIVAHLDWLPTLLAVAGDAEVTDKLLKGYKVGDMNYKIHVDGYHLVAYLTSEQVLVRLLARDILVAPPL